MQYWYRIHAALARGKTIASAPLCCSKGFFYKSYNNHLHSLFDPSTMSRTMLPVKIADFVGDATSSLPPTQLHMYIFAPDVASRPVMSQWMTLIVVHLRFSHLPDAFLVTGTFTGPNQVPAQGTWIGPNKTLGRGLRFSCHWLAK